MRFTVVRSARRRRRRPTKGLRPTQNRVRQAIFNILGEKLSGARVLELFAGTGALGKEALTRGAAEVVFVERHRRTAQYLRDTVTTAGSSAQVIVGDALKVMPELTGRQFDVIIADPPYEQGLDQKTVQAIVRYHLLAQEGIAVIEHSKRDEPQPLGGLTLHKKHRFGDTVLSVFYRASERNQ